MTLSRTTIARSLGFFVPANHAILNPAREWPP